MKISHITSVGHFPSLQISNIGCSADPKNNRFGPGKRDIWLIHYVTKGKGYFNGNAVTAGQGFLIYRGQTECYYPDETNPWEFLWITLNGDAREIFDQYDADKKTQIFNYDFIFIIKNIMKYLKVNNQRIMTCGEISEIFLHIFNQHKNQNKNAKSNEDEYVDFSMNYIKTHLHTQLRVKEIADIIGVSPTYLFCSFKNRFGISPKQYISNLKLHTAEKYLTESELSITEIANSIGFQDVLTFSRFFSTKAGVSPTGYRKRHKR